MKLLYTLMVLIVSTVFFNYSSHKNFEETKLNEIQVIGSHNSYKIAIEKPLFDYLLETRPELSSLEYEHIPLSEQLDLGLRSLELDVFYDPEGGYYAGPKGLDIVSSKGASPQPFDEEEKLKLPGLKVFHVQEIDFRSHQLLFKDALEELKNWSQANEGHTPIIITINAKDAEIPGMRKPLPFTAEALQSIDTEILRVFDESQLISPDRIRGNFDLVEQAVLTNGWPLLSEVKNGFMFVLDEGEEKSDAYLSHFPNSEGALMFVNKEEGNPNAAFMIINDPIKNFEKIKNLVSLGYMVRTRADANTKEARENDYGRFEKAKASGAQVITTDYYLPSTFFESDFKVVFEDGGYERKKY
ncbi:MAG: phosphatidylinositol-specific phospholipase C1-like protein [Cyclobacterium sp.]|uniref:phosphatidylinositol-specific phospholipase C1-like protein n=1 Tax=Cyclobacterium sp. TaxID=1966343 RepID=UPI003970BA47